MPYVIYLGLFMPLLGFLGLTAFYQVIGRRLAGIIACSTIFISFVSFLTLLVMYLNTGMTDEQITLFSFVPIKGIQADFSLHLDSLSLLMTLIITGVGFL